MRFQFIFFAAVLLAAFTSASPAKFSERIRANWEAKGIKYPGQKKRPLVETLVSAPFRETLGQDAWGRSWSEDSRVRVGDGHAVDAKADQSPSHSKKLKVFDWESDHSFGENSLSGGDSDWAPSDEKNKWKGASGAAASTEAPVSSTESKSVSSSDSSTESQAVPSSTTSHTDQATSSRQSKTAIPPSTKKTMAEIHANIEKNKKLFDKVWKESDLSLKMSPLVLAKIVREMTGHGMKDADFRRTAGAYVRRHASSKYDAEYKFYANKLREDALREFRRSHLPPIRVELNQPIVKPVVISENSTRKKKDDLMNWKVEEAVRQHLKRKRIDHRKTTLLHLEEATRDVPKEDIDCNDKTFQCRINGLLKKWKKPTVVEWHQYTTSKRKYHDQQRWQRQHG